MELQTFVEAKDSEEPLCWDPWKEETAMEWEGEPGTVMHLSYTNFREGKACKKVITASLHKAYLFHSASPQYVVWD